MPSLFGGPSLHKICETGSERDLEKLCSTDPAKFKAQIGAKRGFGGFTPMHIAVQNGRSEIIRKLLKTDEIDPNMTDGTLQTPLHLAIAADQLECAINLLTMRTWSTIRLDLQDKLGKTPLQLAEDSGKPFFTLMLLITELRQRLSNMSGDCTSLAPDDSVTELLSNIGRHMASVGDLIGDSLCRAEASRVLGAARDILLKACEECFNKNAVRLLGLAVRAGLGDHTGKLFRALVEKYHRSDSVDLRPQGGGASWGDVLGCHLGEAKEKCLLLVAVADAACQGQSRILRWIFGEEALEAAQAPSSLLQSPIPVPWPYVCEWRDLALAYRTERAANLRVAIDVARQAKRDLCVAVLLCHCYGQGHGQRQDQALQGPGEPKELDWRDLRLEKEHMQCILEVSDHLGDETFASLCHTAGRLCASGNAGIGWVPRAVCRLRNLTWLDLSRTGVGSHLARHVFVMPKLRHLNLSESQLRALPADLRVISSSLQELLLARNSLKHLPPCLRHSNIETLDLTGNLLERLPDFICGMRLLRKLNLRSNPALKELPRAFGLLQLEEFCITGCAFPHEILQKSHDPARLRKSKIGEYHGKESVPAGQIAIIGRESRAKDWLVRHFQEHWPSLVDQCRSVVDFGAPDFFASCAPLMCSQRHVPTFVICCTPENGAEDAVTALQAVKGFLAAATAAAAAATSTVKPTDIPDVGDAASVIAIASSDAITTDLRAACLGRLGKAVHVDGLIYRPGTSDTPPGLSKYVQYVWGRARIQCIPSKVPGIYRQLANRSNLPLFVTSRDFFRLVGRSDVPDPSFDRQLLDFLRACGRVHQLHGPSPEHASIFCTDMSRLCAQLKLLATCNATIEQHDLATAATATSHRSPTAGIAEERHQLGMLGLGRERDRSESSLSTSLQELDITAILLRLLETCNLAFRIDRQYWYLPLTLRDVHNQPHVVSNAVATASDVVHRHYIVSETRGFAAFRHRLCAQILSRLPELLRMSGMAGSASSVHCWRDGVAAVVTSSSCDGGDDGGDDIAGARLIFAIKLSLLEQNPAEGRRKSSGCVRVSAPFARHTTLLRLMDVVAQVWHDELEGLGFQRVTFEQATTFAKCGPHCIHYAGTSGIVIVPQCAEHCPDSIKDAQEALKQPELADVVSSRFDPEYDSFHDLEEMGEGSFGRVYRHRDKNVVIKVLKHQPGVLPQTLMELRQEWSVLDRLRACTFVVAARSLGTSPRRIVMEYAGPTLAVQYTVPGASRPARELLRRLAMQMVAAVAYMHELRIAHRDVKPDNFVLSGTGLDCADVNVKLIDFGSALHLPVGRWRANIGTDEYRAPEMKCKDSRSSEKELLADVFSLGVAVLELMAGRTVASFPSHHHRHHAAAAGRTGACQELKEHTALLEHVTRTATAGLAAVLHLAKSCVKAHATLRPTAPDAALFACSLEAQMLLHTADQLTVAEAQLRSTIFSRLPEARSRAIAGGVLMATNKTVFNEKRYTNGLVRLPLSGADQQAAAVRSKPWQDTISSLLVIAAVDPRHCDRVVIGTRRALELYDTTVDGDLRSEPAFRKAYEGHEDDSCWSCITADDRYVYAGHSESRLLVLNKWAMLADGGDKFLEWEGDLAPDRLKFAIGQMEAVRMEDGDTVLLVIAKCGNSSQLLRCQVEAGLETPHIKMLLGREEHSLLRCLAVSSGHAQRVWVSSGCRAMLWDVRAECNACVAEVDLREHRRRVGYRTHVHDYVKSLCCANGVLYAGTKHGLVYMFRDDAPPGLQPGGWKPELLACLKAHHRNVQHLVGARMRVAGMDVERDVMLSCGLGNGLCPVDVPPTLDPVPLCSSARRYKCPRPPRSSSAASNKLFDELFETDCSQGGSGGSGGPGSPALEESGGSSRPPPAAGGADQGQLALDDGLEALGAIRHSPMQDAHFSPWPLEEDDEGFREPNGALSLVVSVWEALTPDEIVKLDKVRQWVTESGGLGM